MNRIKSAIIAASVALSASAYAAGGDHGMVRICQHTLNTGDKATLFVTQKRPMIGNMLLTFRKSKEVINMKYAMFFDDNKVYVRLGATDNDNDYLAIVDFDRFKCSDW